MSAAVLDSDDRSIHPPSHLVDDLPSGCFLISSMHDGSMEQRGTSTPSGVTPTW